MHEIIGDYYESRDASKPTAPASRRSGTSDWTSKLRIQMKRRHGWGARSTAEIAGGIDMWCRLRRYVMKSSNWRPLVELARAVDPEPCGSARPVRSHMAEALPTMQAKASDLKALEKQPAASLLLLSMTLADSRDIPAARAVLRVAGRRFPGEYWVRYEQGYASRIANRSPKRYAISMPRSHCGPELRRPSASRRSPPRDRAVRRGVGGIPRSAPIESRTGLAHNGLGRAFLDLKRIDEAVAEFREATRIRPDHPVPHEFLGVALRVQGKLDEAVAEFRTAMTLDGNRVARRRLTSRKHCSTGPPR